MAIVSDPKWSGYQIFYAVQSDKPNVPVYIVLYLIICYVVVDYIVFRFSISKEPSVIPFGFWLGSSPTKAYFVKLAFHYLEMFYLSGFHLHSLNDG